MAAPSTSKDDTSIGDRFRAAAIGVRATAHLLAGPTPEPSLQEWLTKDTAVEPERLVLLGPSGAGKTTLLNELVLGMQLLPAGSAISTATTSAAIALRRWGEADIEVEVCFLSASEWMQTKGDLRTQTKIKENKPGSTDLDAGLPAEQSRSVFSDVYSDDAERDNVIEPMEVTQVLGTRHIRRFADSNEARQFISLYSVSRSAYAKSNRAKKGFPVADPPSRFLWPLVASITVTGNFPNIPYNVVLMDLPGVDDVCQARRSISQTHLALAKSLWVLFPWEKMLVGIDQRRNLQKTLSLIQETQSYRFVGTKGPSDFEEAREELPEIAETIKNWKTNGPIQREIGQDGSAASNVDLTKIRVEPLSLHTLPYQKPLNPLSEEYQAQWKEIQADLVRCSESYQKRLIESLQELSSWVDSKVPPRISPQAKAALDWLSDCLNLLRQPASADLETHKHKWRMVWDTTREAVFRYSSFGFYSKASTACNFFPSHSGYGHIDLPERLAEIIFELTRFEAWFTSFQKMVLPAVGPHLPSEMALFRRQTFPAIIRQRLRTLLANNQSDLDIIDKFLSSDLLSLLSDALTTEVIRPLQARLQPRPPPVMNDIDVTFAREILKGLQDCIQDQHANTPLPLPLRMRSSPTVRQDLTHDSMRQRFESDGFRLGDECSDILSALDAALGRPGRVRPPPISFSVGGLSFDVVALQVAAGLLQCTINLEVGLDESNTIVTCLGYQSAKPGARVIRIYRNPQTGTFFPLFK